MNLIAWIGAALALIAAVGAAWKVISKIAKAVKSITHFADDWFGEDARPGVPARLGVMSRLEGIQTDVGKIKHELWPNSGSSLRDAVDRLEKTSKGGKA